MALVAFASATEIVHFDLPSKLCLSGAGLLLLLSMAFGARINGPFTVQAVSPNSLRAHIDDPHWEADLAAARSTLTGEHLAAYLGMYPGAREHR